MFKLNITWKKSLGTSRVEGGTTHNVDTPEQAGAVIDHELRIMQAQATAENTPYVVYLEGFVHGELQQYEAIIIQPEGAI